MSAGQLIQMLGDKMVNPDLFASPNYQIHNLWTGEVSENCTGIFGVERLAPYDNVTVRVTCMER